ncbi:LLM class flavin-dependent oxidoreductase [Pseudooceanicola sp.]|uniref:LLM class flavin-dependent oxidoreductase n=1 Tax=Pseudooceanicola sp. TaxID=1914328 RepID=UPI003511AA92
MTGHSSAKFMQGEGFKLGIFGYLHSSGASFSKAPDRWRADWSDIVSLARMADAAGLDFLLPYARWKGLRGEVDHREHSFETLSAAAALAAVTRRIGVFATVHAPIIHPVIAAKITNTIDHASGGRAGINIVCGWNAEDFAMFGLEILPHEARYAHGREWFEIWSRLSGGVADPYDFDGNYFRNLKGLEARPGAVQRPWPVTISAAFSPTGRAFALDTSDYLLTNATTLETGAEEIRQINAQALAQGRSRPLGSILVSHVVCRESRAEAEEYQAWFAEEQADDFAVDNWLGARAANATMPDKVAELRARVAGGGSNMPLIGSPSDVAEQLVEIRRAGFAATAMSFPHYTRDLPLFVQQVLPQLDGAGIRAQDAAA